jgi:Cysteine rich repeat
MSAFGSKADMDYCSAHVGFDPKRKSQRCQSKPAALACGKELQKQCGGVPVLANNMNECLKKSQRKLSARCVTFANYVVRSCERDAVQYCQAVAAGQSNILGCLRTAKRVVSPPCNAALDAAFLRQ